MSKVLVDRELLRDCSAELSDWRMSFTDAETGMTGILVATIDAILAQIEEAEGVVERQRMIESMCLTWRHDFGLHKPEDCEFSSGMTAAEREHLRGQMAKLFDHHFGPALSAVTAERDLAVQGGLQIIAERDAFRVEVEALRKDAERYRWIRNPDQAIGHVIDKMASPGIYEYRAGDELDDAIDDAMRQT